VKHDILIVGGGVSGTALLYTLARYTNIKNIGLIEKYSDLGLVNSSSKMNSQTLHFGDIETNYTFEKAKIVKQSADMVLKYLEAEERKGSKYNLFSRYSKMVLAVGQEQVNILRGRYKTFSTLYPNLRIIEKEEIGKIEPRVLDGRNPEQELLALMTKDGITVDFGELCHSFADNAKKENPDVKIYLSTQVSEIIRTDDHYKLITNNGEFEAPVVIVSAGGHSLKMAKSIGYGKNFSILSMAGSFYTGPKVLNGKVYTMQVSKLPFAAIHGDPEVHDSNVTRFGPTAKPIFFLERYNRSTFFEYWKTFGLGIKPILSIINISSDKIIFNYLLKNVIYDLPFFGKRSFLKEVKKIVPGIKLNEIKFAKGYGGTRPQIINNSTRKLELGEAKITGDNIIFNVTPSPGASTCLGNAYVDTLKILEFFENKYIFKKDLFESELVK